MTINLATEFNEENIVTGGTIPWIQCLNPPNVSLKKITEDDWGLWLSAENAEAIGFNPDDDPNWRLVELDNDWENNTGYLSHATRFLVVHQSELEVQEKSLNGKGWRFVDLAYKHGVPTAAMERCQKDKGTSMRSVVRVLLIILGKNNEPLHDGVVRFTMRGVLGASFGAQYRFFKAEANKSFFANLGQPEKRLSDDILNRFVFPFSMSVAPPRTSDASPSIYVSGRASLVVPENTVTEVYGRKVNLYRQTFDDLYQPKDSVLGQKLAEYRAEYSEFPFSRNNKEDDPTESNPLAAELDIDPMTGEVLAESEFSGEVPF